MEAGRPAAPADVLEVGIRFFSTPQSFPLKTLDCNLRQSLFPVPADGGSVTVSLAFFQGRDFKTGQRGTVSSLRSGYVSISTDEEDGTQSIWIDGETRDGTEFKGKWMGVLKDIEAPFE